MFSFMKEKLCFECLHQIVTLGSREIDAGHDDFSAR